MLDEMTRAAQQHALSQLGDDNAPTLVRNLCDVELFLAADVMELIPRKGPRPFAARTGSAHELDSSFFLAVTSHLRVAALTEPASSGDDLEADGALPLGGFSFHAVWTEVWVDGL